MSWNVVYGHSQKGNPVKEVDLLSMEFIDVEEANVILNGTKGIALVVIPKGKNLMLEAKSWVPPLEDEWR